MSRVSTELEVEPSGRLEPGRFVDDVAERLAGGEAAAVVEQDLQAPLVEVGAEAGRVRRDQHAGCGPQRMLGGQRLLLEHVERGPRDLAGAQRGDEVVEPRRLAARSSSTSGAARRRGSTTSS